MRGGPGPHLPADGIVAARTAAGGGNGFTYGFLLAGEEARGLDTERDFAKILKNLRPLPG